MDLSIWGNASPAQALEAVSRAATAAGFRVEKASDTRLLLFGKVRPAWATAAGAVFAVPTLGLSLLMLKVRRPTRATVTLKDGPVGMLVQLGGVFPEYLPSVIEQMIANEQAAAAHGNQPVDGRFATQSAAGAWTVASVVMAAGRPLTPPSVPADPPPAITHVPLWNGGSGDDVNATIARPWRINLTASAPVLQFDNGESLTLRSNALIGRAPSASPDDPPGQLMRIEDTSLTVSKTHLAVGVDAQGVWLCDRHSTNGTTITTENGVKTPCAAGVRHYVKPGETVHMGDRSFSVLLGAALPAGRTR